MHTGAIVLYQPFSKFDNDRIMLSYVMFLMLCYVLILCNTVVYYMYDISCNGNCNVSV